MNPINSNIDLYFQFPYQLDEFQLSGCKIIGNNENLLVTAHTGAGKTALALYAIAKTLAENKKVIYTSPIKTLSNQKYAEFSEHFSSVGIMTGDIKINPLANLLIMTAEILRNSLLRGQYKSDSLDNEIISEWTYKEDEIGCVILDEVHYINNKERGKIWEEILINLEPNIQLVMLSATITGANEMAKWISDIKKIKCHLVTTDKRPVPLQHGIWWEDEITYFLYGDKNWKEGIWGGKYNQINKFYKYNSFSLNEFFKCLKYLFQNNMTPANIFLLNRKLIEEYAKKIPLYFVTSDEIAQIHKIWNQKLHKYKKIYEQTKEWNDLFQLVLKGIGIHHSGMIPILKEIVEILYSQGLLKILLTTETFALGVNMPTKTTVFFDVTKFDGETSYRSLYPEEYNQMAGRAGRRGKDFIGYIVILPSYNFIPEYEAKQMIITKPQKIQSKLSLDTLFILKELSSMNTISTETINNLDKIINYISSKYNNSFYYYQDININNKLEYEFNKFKTNLDELINTSNINASIVEKYIKINNINKKLKPDGIIQLNNKIKKKYLNESKLLENEIKNYDIKLIENFIFYTNKLNELNTLLNIKNKTNEQFTLLLNFLQYNNYIDDNYIITKNGKIISEINECNPFLLLALIQHDNFNNLEFPEIVALVSLLINEYKSKDDIYITDLDCSLKCKEILTYITAYSNEYNKKENNLNNMLPYPCWLDWTINLSTFNCVKLWTENNSWSVITTKYNIFQGNFIKTILRVTNILKNIEIIANIFNNINLINKLDGYLEKIIRDIVITDSLYLN